MVRNDLGTDPIEYDGVAIYKAISKSIFKNGNLVLEPVVPQGIQALCDESGMPFAMCDIGTQVPGARAHSIVLNPVDYEIVKVSYKRSRERQSRPTPRQAWRR